MSARAKGRGCRLWDIFLLNFTESLTGRLGIDEFAEVGDGLNARATWTRADDASSQPGKGPESTWTSTCRVATAAAEEPEPEEPQEAEDYLRPRPEGKHCPRRRPPNTRCGRHSCPN
jgi:hypothetical protein